MHKCWVQIVSPAVENTHFLGVKEAWTRAIPLIINIRTQYDKQNVSLKLQSLQNVHF